MAVATKGITVTAIEESEMVKLDFGEYGSVEVPPEVAMSFVCNQTVRDQIRTQSLKAMRRRKQAKTESNGHVAIVTG